MDDQQNSLLRGEPSQNFVSSSMENICMHPGSYARVCVKCGKNIDDKTGVALGYVHKNLRLQDDEISQLRDFELKNLVHQKKLCLVLDLDHTLLNSVGTRDITPEELYLLKPEILLEVTRKNLIKFDWIEMVTKLRPYIRTFLKEANKSFEMYIYTKGDRLYATHMAKLLDPGDDYFSSKIIFQEDCAQLHNKGLDLILGKESAVLILDDTEWVWEKHKENLMLIKRYNFFASSCKAFGCKFKSLSERKRDELETVGALASILRVLQQIHISFFDSERTDNLEDRDVREVLKIVRKEILKGCKIVFGSIFPAHFRVEHHRLFWKMAEQLGATCLTDLDPSSVTHVVCVDSDEDKAQWALKEKKFLVTPKWIEAANCLWKKPREEKFPVTEGYLLCLLALEFVSEFKKIRLRMLANGDAQMSLSLMLKYANVRVKRQRIEFSKSTDDQQSSLFHGEPSQNLGTMPAPIIFSKSSPSEVSSSVENVCTHPGSYAGICVKCGGNIDDKTGVALGYIHKNLRLGFDEISRLRDNDLKDLLRQRKLCLVLDLDHTLLNSASVQDITLEEQYLLKLEILPDAFRRSLVRLYWIQMLTKLRPYVQTFLREASKLFEMYIYTLGERRYALEMAKLLDPDGICFSSKVITQEDCTQLHKKGLDVILGKESAVLILDDTEWVWENHKENLMLIERYHFFASSCKVFGCKFKSLSERGRDEVETDGALASILRVLQQIHTSFFDSERTDNLEDRDVRQVLKTIRKEVLKGCNLVFSIIFPAHFSDEHHELFWEMAEQLGATCMTKLEPSVTHVVSVDSDTVKARWALQEKKFLVSPK